jgi:type IV pilus assembly protein PilO
VRASAWRDRWLWWLPALLLLVINLFAYGWFQFAYSGAAESLSERLESRVAEAEEVEARVDRQRVVLNRVKATENRVAEFSAARLASPEARLTAVLREVSSLAGKAGLEPSSFRYPEDELGDYGMSKRWVNFSISGTYMELRRFINLLELSDFFLTLEEVSLSNRSEEEELRISLSVSTLFSTVPLERPAEEGQAP